MSNTARQHLHPAQIAPHSQWLPLLPLPLYARALAAARSISRSRGQTLFRQSEPAQWVYLLGMGQLRLFQISPEGHQIGFDLLLPIRDLGLIAAVPNAEYPLTAQALSTTHLLAWPHLLLHSLCEHYPPLSLHLMRLAHAHSLQLTRQTYELMTLRVEQRIARCILRLAAHIPPPATPTTPLVIPLSRQHLAELTTTTPGTVSRTLSVWTQQGILTAQRTTIALHEMEPLYLLAGMEPLTQAERVPPC